MGFDIDNLYEIFETRFDIAKEDLLEKESFSDLGLDSIAILSMLQDLEEILHVEFDSTNLNNLNSVPKIYNYILEYQASGKMS